MIWLQFEKIPTVAKIKKLIKVINVNTMIKELQETLKIADHNQSAAVCPNSRDQE